MRARELVARGSRQSFASGGKLAFTHVEDIGLAAQIRTSPAMADGSMDGLISSVVRMSSGEITSMLGEKNGGLDDSAVMQRDSVGDGIENPLGASFGTALAPLDDAVDLGGLRLLITKHTIHREDHVGSANHSYVVSKEKWFWLGIQLVDGQGRMAVGNTLDLSACVVYESGVPVNSLVASEPLLLGQLEAHVIRGVAQFKLKMGSSTLSPTVRQIAADGVVLEPEPIGEGGFSIVFRGTWNQQGTFGRTMTRSRKIAAKRSRVAGLGAEIQNDMVRELAVMADFPHQNVLIVHGVSDIPGAGIHVITELMAYDLDDVIHQHVRGPLVHQDILHVARDVAAGLAHLHANRIMHRDLKPSNVLIAEGSGIIRCKIADFGISKELTHTLTKMTCKQGTCAYMAPEMLSDDGRVGTSADAYAYGVLAWELLSGKKPWTGKSEHQIHNALVRGERLPRPEAPVVPELADWAVECFGVAAERPTMHALETKLDELLSTDERDLDTLRARLAEAQRGDADAYDEAWENYASDPRCGEMLELCATLAKKRAETPRQPESCKSVEELQSLAKSVRDDFHDELRAVVTRAGGTYMAADTKARARCVEKASREYDGDVRRIVDIERAAALFTSVPALHEGVRQLSQLGGDLEVVRVKDSFGEPKPSGWRCVYFNFKHVPSGVVGELQVTFDRIKKSTGGRIRTPRCDASSEASSRLTVTRSSQSSGGARPRPRARPKRGAAARAAAAAEAGEKHARPKRGRRGGRQASRRRSQGRREKQRRAAAAASRRRRGTRRAGPEEREEVARGHQSVPELRRAGREPQRGVVQLGAQPTEWGWSEASYEPYARCIALDPKHVRRTATSPSC